MEANELRLGNWVKVEFDYEVVKAINEITLWCALGGKGEGCMQLHSDVSPIFLDEEWLIKFGFKYRTDTGFNGWYSNIILGESIRIFEVENKWYKYSSAHIVIKYVHQLQNLYFALTGEELTINN